MGTYILFTINHRVVISKKELLGERVSFEEMMEAVNEVFPLSAYELIEREHVYEFRAKESIFNADQFSKFLTNQYRLLSVDTKDQEAIMKQLSTLKTYEDIVRFANKKPYPNFQSHMSFMTVYHKPFKSFRVTFEGVIFFLAGKAFLECYDHLFAYLEALIKENSPCEIARLTKVTLSL